MHGRVGIHNISHTIYQADNQFREVVAGRCLAGKYESSGNDLGIRHLSQPEIQSDNMQQIEVLPLVFMKPLGLDIEQGVGIQ